MASPKGLSAHGPRTTSVALSDTNETSVPAISFRFVALEAELAKAVALAGDVPELVMELRQRSARIQKLEIF
jgi:hypothetical protein